MPIGSNNFQHSMSDIHVEKSTPMIIGVLVCLSDRMLAEPNDAPGVRARATAQDPWEFEADVALLERHVNLAASRSLDVLDCFRERERLSVELICDSLHRIGDGHGTAEESRVRIEERDDAVEVYLCHGGLLPFA